MQLKAPVVRFRHSHSRPAFVQTFRSQQIRDMSKTNPGVKLMRHDMAAVLGLTESLRNVHVGQILPQRQQVVGNPASGPSRPPASKICSSDTSPGIRLNKVSLDLFSTRSRSKHSSIHSTPHVTTRQIHIGTHWCVTRQITRVRQLQFL